MYGYIGKRLLAVIPVLLGLSLVVFLIMRMIPGNQATAMLGAYATPENVAKLNAELGLNQPLPVQYFIWLDNILHGNLGCSYTVNRPVLDVVMQRFGATLILAITALILCTVWGLLAGVVSAVRQYSWTDRVVTLLILTGISLPSFWLGLILILAFAVDLHWLPASGMYEVYGGGGPVDLLRHLVLPAFTLAVGATAVIARLTRSNMLEVLRQDYIRTARANGLSESRVVYRHAFKTALVNVIPVIGVQAGFVLGGAVYIETVFQWPGIGRMLVQAIESRDILLVQGGVLVVASQLRAVQPRRRHPAEHARPAGARMSAVAASLSLQGANLFAVWRRIARNRLAAFGALVLPRSVCWCCSCPYCRCPHRTPPTSATRCCQRSATATCWAPTSSAATCYRACSGARA